MRKKQKNKAYKKLSISLIVIDFIAIFCFVLAYGSFSFKSWLVTTAMRTATHRYFAYILYDEAIVNEVLESNKVIEIDEDSDTSKIIFNSNPDTGVYESIYEEQILRRDKNNDVYKIVNLKGNGYKGYMAVIYDPSKLQLVFSKKYGTSGEYISTMAKNNKALVAINGSGVQHSGGNKVTGVAIKDGKVYAKGRNINKGGGLIGFTKNNVLMLTKKSANEAIKAGMDRAVEFGPFLIVNGKESTFKGNGGWGIANRTAIGQRQDGIVLLVVIDGRSSESKGISMVDLKDLFVRYKAYNASNLDGGGSSAMYAVVNGKGKLINNPQGFGYSGERYLPNAWMVLSDNK